MPVPIPVLIVVSLIASAYVKLNAVILGRPVSVSPLLLVAVIVILALGIGLLWVLRALILDGLRLRPAWTGGSG